MGFFKKIGGGIKKFAGSGIGKVVIGAAGLAAGTGLALKGIRAAKGVAGIAGRGKIFKGIGSREASGIRKGKGLFGGLFQGKGEKDKVMTGSMKRLLRKYEKKKNLNTSEAAQLAELQKRVSGEVSTNPQDYSSQSQNLAADFTSKSFEASSDKRVDVINASDNGGDIELEIPWYKKPFVLIGGAVVLVLSFLGWLFMGKK